MADWRSEFADRLIILRKAVSDEEVLAEWRRCYQETLRAQIGQFVENVIATAPSTNTKLARMLGYAGPNAFNAAMQGQIGTAKFLDLYQRFGSHVPLPSLPDREALAYQHAMKYVASALRVSDKPLTQAIYDCVSQLANDRSWWDGRGDSISKDRLNTFRRGTCDFMKNPGSPLGRGDDRALLEAVQRLFVAWGPEYVICQDAVGLEGD
jgi:hypothetical protein